MEENETKCACKGVRSCLICENKLQTHLKDSREPQESNKTFIYCMECRRPFTDRHPHHGESQELPGILIIENFVTIDEEAKLVDHVDTIPWTLSQSGRRKQDFGPKVNFKKKKVKSSVFSGLPHFSEEIVTRMQEIDEIKNFVPVEQCQLEYTPDRGSAIDPHYDDFWLWGERLVTLNLLSDTYLSFTKDSDPSVEILVPLLRRSLIVVYGPARYEWKHGIKREHIVSRRLAMTFRELSGEFMEGGERCDEGKQLIDVAMTYRGIVVN